MSENKSQVVVKRVRPGMETVHSCWTVILFVHLVSTISLWFFSRSCNSID